MVAMEHVALTRIASGYSSGLEETIERLQRMAEESSPLDVDTGAIKPGEFGGRLSLEVNRCQRMELSLGLLELHPRLRRGASPRRGPARAACTRWASACARTCAATTASASPSDGGFLLVLPDISRRGLAGAAERLRRELDACAGSRRPPGLVFALAHYDFVDVNATRCSTGSAGACRKPRARISPSPGRDGG